MTVSSREKLALTNTVSSLNEAAWGPVDTRGPWGKRSEGSAVRGSWAVSRFLIRPPYNCGPFLPILSRRVGVQAPLPIRKNAPAQYNDTLPATVRCPQPVQHHASHCEASEAASSRQRRRP